MKNTLISLLSCMVCALISGPIAGTWHRWSAQFEHQASVKTTVPFNRIARTWAQEIREAIYARNYTQAQELLKNARTTLTQEDTQALLGDTDLFGSTLWISTAAADSSSNTFQEILTTAHHGRMSYQQIIHNMLTRVNHNESSALRIAVGNNNQKTVELILLHALELNMPPAQLRVLITRTDKQNSSLITAQPDNSARVYLREFLASLEDENPLVKSTGKGS